MLRVFDAGPLLFYAAAFVIGGALGSIVRAVKGDGRRSFKTGLEAGLLAAIGAFLSASVVSWLLSAAGDSDGAALLVGFAMFLWVGAIDLVTYAVTGDLFVGADHMVWVGLAVGGCAGLFAGVHRIYDWKGLGWIAFPLDVTWGLAGTTNGCLIHLVNVLLTTHAPETRKNAHRYLGGFRVKGGFAFTQGAVMSNLHTGPPAPGSRAPSLYRHERTHVWQNRVFGPFFMWSFLAWMAVMVLPGCVAGAADRHASAGTGVMWWTYYDNPWEVWAYRFGGARSHPSALMCWPAPVALVAAAVFYPLFATLFVWLVRAGWFA